jgi:hypothetical protein
MPAFPPAFPDPSGRMRAVGEKDQPDAEWAASASSAPSASGRMFRHQVFRHLFGGHPRMPRKAKAYLHRGWFVTNLNSQRHKLCREEEGYESAQVALGKLLDQ